MVAVTGATGEIGGRVARALAERGVAQRLVVRDAARTPSLGAEVAVGEYRDGEAMRRAFEGAATVFLVSAGESPDRAREHFSAVDAAVAAGVARLVYLSYMGAGEDTVFTFGRDHWATEQHVRETGLEFTFLRSCMYADYAPVFAADGVIRGPAGQGRVGWVARDDVAAVAAIVVAEPEGHAGSSYDMTGPEALDLERTAALLSEVAGRSIPYEEETLEQARESRRPSGHPDWEIEGWVTSYAAIAAGELEAVSDTVERITGRRPRSLPEFLREHPESYAHLTGG